MATSNPPAGPDDTVIAPDSATTAEVPGQPGHVAQRSLPLTLLAVVATIFMLDWAQPVLIPLAIALIISYALGPLVDLLERVAIPRALSAAVLLLAIIGGIGAATWSLRDEAMSLLETLPEAVLKIQEAARKEFSGPGTALEKVQEAADEFERATAEDEASRPRPGVTRVQIEKPKLDIRQYLVTTLAGGAALIGAGLIVLFLAFFLLASGDAFRRKWVRLSGPTLARRRITVQVMDAIRSQIQRYLGVQVLTSVIVGVASGLAFWAIGLENAAVWGVAAGVLNMIPYLGAIVTIGGTALVAFFQFGTVGMALAVASISFVINTIEGSWLTPWLSGRVSHMNAVVVFSGLLFWGWLWGGWGLLLGLPIMMVIKAICDHVEDLKPIGEFMGE